MRPPKYTDDPKRFAHVDLAHTDIRITFLRIRREQARAIAAAVERAVKVTDIRRKERA